MRPRPFMAMVEVARRSMKSRSWLTRIRVPSIVGQQVLEQVERVHVEVVGRFVEHQQVGGLGQGAGQQQAVALAARQARDRLAQLGLGEQEVLGVGGDVLGHRRAPGWSRRRRGSGRPTGSCRTAPSRDWSSRTTSRLVPSLTVPASAQFAQQQLDQGGLAGAVGADDGEAVAAQDAGGEVLRSRARRTLGHALGLGDQLARDAPVDADVLARRLSLRRGASCAQVHQGAGAAFVAGPAGGDAERQKV
jgi:hypothetical protein